MANGINRYYLPAQQQVMDTYVPLPFKEILMAGQAQQEAYDDLREKIGTLEDSEFYALDPYKDYVTDKQSELYSDIEDIYDAFSTGNLRSGRTKYLDAQRKWKRELNPLTGVTGKAMQAYDTRVEYAKALDEANPIQKKALLEYQDELYAQKSKDVYNVKEMTGYSTEDAVNFVNSTDWALDKLQYIKSSTNSYAEARPDGKGYIFKRNGSDEVVSDAEIASVLLGPQWQSVMQGDLSKLGGLAAGDPELKAYMEQGLRTGYFNMGELLNAVVGTAEAGSFIKEERATDLQKDWLYEHNMKKEEEFEAALPLGLPDYQAPVVDELTRAQREGVWEAEFVGEEFGEVKGVKTFDVAENNMRNQIGALKNKLADLEAGAATVEFKGSAESDARIIEQEILRLESEIAKNQELKKNIQMQSYNIDTEFLRENGYGSVEEFLADKEDFQKEITTTHNTLATNDSHLQELKDDIIRSWSEGRQYDVVYDDEGYASLKLKEGKTDPDMIKELYLDKRVSDYNKALEEHKETVKELSLKASEDHRILGVYGVESGDLDGINNLYKSFNNYDAAVEDNADSYINGRTVTSPQQIFSTDQVADDPMLSTLQEYMNTNNITFYSRDDQGNRTKYNPVSVDISKGVSAAVTRNKVNFAGTKVDMTDGRTVILATDPTTHKIVEAEIDQGLVGSNLLPYLKKKAKDQMMYYQGIGDMDSYGDALIRYASADQGQLHSVFTATIKEFNDLGESVNPVDKTKLLISKGIETAGGNKIFFSRDAEPDMDGRQYNMYAPGITKKDIESGAIYKDPNIFQELDLEGNPTGDWITIDEEGNTLYVVQRLKYSEVVPTVVETSGFVKY